MGDRLGTPSVVGFFFFSSSSIPSTSRGAVSFKLAAEVDRSEGNASRKFRVANPGGFCSAARRKRARARFRRRLEPRPPRETLPNLVGRSSTERRTKLGKTRVAAQSVPSERPFEIRPKCTGRSSDLGIFRSKKQQIANIFATECLWGLKLSGQVACPSRDAPSKFGRGRGRGRAGIRKIRSAGRIDSKFRKRVLNKLLKKP